ncbi:hypothetical protein V6N13_061298 [Hibiscus sabdariffa]|uniref:Uncharacterized protein n=1 Tax=Hibiscus sabdariffa TaxID=183260 RepID=A0ABR2EFR4_9ROSI
MPKYVDLTTGYMTQECWARFWDACDAGPAIARCTPGLRNCGGPRLGAGLVPESRVGYDINLASGCSRLGRTQVELLVFQHGLIIKGKMKVGLGQLDRFRDDDEGDGRVWGLSMMIVVPGSLMETLGDERDLEINGEVMFVGDRAGIEEGGRVGDDVVE